MSEKIGFIDPPVGVRPVAAVVARPERGFGEAVPGGPIKQSEPVSVPVAPPTPGAPTPLVVAALATAGLTLALVLLSLGNFVADQFARSEPLGFTTLAILLAGGGALGWAAWREWRGLAQLGTIDAIRTNLASENVETVREAALQWLKGAGIDGEPVGTIRDARSTAAIRGLLETMILARLDTAATLSGRDAALRVLTATAISPWPGLDGLIVVWRGASLVRQVAQIYGFRPGTLGTLSLVRRVAFDAGTVAAADIAVGAMVESFTHDAVVGRLFGQAAGATIAMRRMLRLARAVADACRPLPRPG